MRSVYGEGIFQDGITGKVVLSVSITCIDCTIQFSDGSKLIIDQMFQAISFFDKNNNESHKK